MVEVGAVGEEAATVAVAHAGGGIVGGELGGGDAVEHAEEVFIVVGDDDFRRAVAIEITDGGGVVGIPIAFEIVEAEAAVGAVEEDVDAVVIAK